MLHKLSISTKKRDEMIEITSEVQKAVSESGIQEGIVTIASAHTTAGITINENADPDVKTDFLRRLDEIFPWNMSQDLHEEGNTAAHLKASTTGSSQQVMIHGGSLVLGTWQGIQFCEFDGPRSRTVFVKIIEG